jgi:hypothetical protein
MRFEFNDKCLWYGAPDAPAPEGVVQVGAGNTIIVGVSPIDASNTVELIYQVNQGSTEIVVAEWVRNDNSRNAQYFRAQFPILQSGDLVRYGVLCRCAGREIPVENLAQLPVSFQIATEDRDQSEPKLNIVEAAMHPPNLENLEEQQAPTNASSPLLSEKITISSEAPSQQPDIAQARSISLPESVLVIEKDPSQNESLVSTLQPVLSKPLLESLDNAEMNVPTEDHGLSLVEIQTPIEGQDLAAAIVVEGNKPQPEEYRLSDREKSAKVPSSFREASFEEATKPTETLSSAIDTAFREDNKVRAVLSEHLTARVQDSQHHAALARAAFENFQPSMFTSKRNNYVAPDGNLAQTMDAVIETAVNTMRESTQQRTLKLHIGDDLKSLVKYSTNDGKSSGTIDLRAFIKFFLPKLEVVSTLRNDPTRLACDAEAKAKAMLNQIDGKDAPASAGESTTALDEMSEGDGDDESSLVNGFVKDQVHDLMAKVTRPEDQLRFDVPNDVPKRAKLEDTEEARSTFQLRAGASDVTSYHDFNSLQIAFEHVWTEIFDGRLKDLGTQLYHAYIDQRDFLGFKSNPNRVITSIPDLKKILGDIRELSNLTRNSSAPAIKTFSTAGMSFFGAAGMGPFDTASVGPAGAAWAGLFGAAGAANASENDSSSNDQSIEGAKRLSRLLEEVENLLRQPYSFTVFKEESYNFGILVTYRQTWKPETYQVGDLVSTIPLAPREIRRYTTKHVIKKTRAAKEVEDSLRTTRSESSGTSRVEREIIDKAQEKTNWDLTVKDTIGGEGYKADITGNAGGEQAAQSEKAKKHFHEAVLKSAEEYKQQHRMEIDTTASEETEETTFHEIQNPNDELTVTYLFYELQRRYRISERIHQLTPVILVANEVPAPDAISDAWLIKHDWILRRVLLDDSFRPALEYLIKSFVGAELNLHILTTNAQAQKQVVDKLNQQIEVQTRRLAVDESKLADTVKSYADAQEVAGAFNTVKRIFDPLQLGGKVGEGTLGARETMVDYLQETFDRAEREKARLLDQLGVATTALQAAIDKLSAATKEHYDRIAEIDRLRIHVKQNILYYMQAIWNHEPPDQRFFRIYDIDVVIVEPETAGVNVSVNTTSQDLMDWLQGNNETTKVTLPMPGVNLKKKKLVEVADLDTVLGYKGNYAIYALKENNYLTFHMMQDYVEMEMSGELKLRDPDEFSNYTVAELQNLAECMYQHDPKGFEKYRQQFKDLIVRRLASGRAEDDRVIVPTTSLYIEALVGTHPLLEDFKLIHRALDVKKVQAETRHAELENIRLAARALKGETEDPDIEKKIVIDGNGTGVIVEPDGN